MANTSDISREDELMVIKEATKLIGEALDADNAVNKVLRLMSQMLGLNRGRVFLLDSSENRLHIQYSYGLTDKETPRGIYEINEGVTGKVFQQGRDVVVEDIDKEPIYQCKSVDRTVLPAETVSYLAVPIFQKDNVIIGVLGCNRLRNRSRPFQHDLGILKIIAALIGQHLYMSNLVAEKTHQLANANALLKNSFNPQNTFGIIGQSPALQQAMQQAMSFVDTTIPVLLHGESGTGKERFARMLHMAGPRKDEPFIAINCSAIPANLLESELFGYEKGAFTGASQAKQGKFELANGGTLFLDEIADLDYDMQPKLLRVLEEKTLNRIGSVKDIKVDIRLIAATHKNLQDLVNQGKFRIDLFYRLNVLPIALPPLRHRLGDLRILARYFLNNANQEFSRDVIFGNGVLERLESYSWPGNIRQLENVIKRAILLAKGSVIERDDIAKILMQESTIDNSADSSYTREGIYKKSTMHFTPPLDEPHQDFSSVRPYHKVNETEAEQIIRAVKQAGGNKSRAAMSLGYTARQLRYRIEKLALDI